MDHKTEPKSFGVRINGRIYPLEEIDNNPVFETVEPIQNEKVEEKDPFDTFFSNTATQEEIRRHDQQFTRRSSGLSFVSSFIQIFLIVLVTFVMLYAMGLHLLERSGDNTNNPWAALKSVILYSFSTSFHTNDYHTEFRNTVQHYFVKIGLYIPNLFFGDVEEKLETPFFVCIYPEKTQVTVLGESTWKLHEEYSYPQNGITSVHVNDVNEKSVKKAVSQMIMYQRGHHEIPSMICMYDFDHGQDTTWQICAFKFTRMSQQEIVIMINPELKGYSDEGTEITERLKPHCTGEPEPYVNIVRRDAIHIGYTSHTGKHMQLLLDDSKESHIFQRVLDHMARYDCFMPIEEEIETVPEIQEIVEE